MNRTCLLAILLTATVVYSEDTTPQELFDQRILPIFRSSDPSSCVQCHLSSVDLKQYILPSQSATFVSLRDQDLINLDHPTDSKILKLIRMGDQDADEGARLIHEKVRTAEYEAFEAWIVACCNDSRLRELPKGTKFAKPSVPDQVIRHARKSRIVDSFARNVFSQRMRCFPCHTPHEIDPENPRHQGEVKKQKEFADTYGAEALERLHFFRETPEETLQFLIKSSQSTPEGRLPMLNLTNPTESLLLLKPTSKVPKKNDDGAFEEPSYSTPVSHMGGLKMHLHDHSYKSFVRWIQDYERVVNGTYKTVDQLPADNWYASKLFLRIKSTPDDWSVGTPVQSFLHEWNENSKDWYTEPIAFTQGTVTPRHFANGTLFLLGSDEARVKNRLEKATLPRGKYLVKVYVDKAGIVRDDPAMILTQGDFVGQIEIPKARWRDGFKFAQVIDAGKLSKSTPRQDFAATQIEQ